MAENYADIAEKFRKDGYAIIPNFLSKEEIAEIQQEVVKLVDLFDEKEFTESIQNGRQDIIASADCVYTNTKEGEDYFLTSSDKIRYFLENSAVDENGNLKHPKLQAMHKLGHALHWRNPVFKKVSFSEKIKNIFKSLKYTDPAIIQGMYLFKNPRIGSEFRPHQDVTYLHVDPPKLVGIWFPMEDATVENGCLHFIPGSHTGEIHHRYYRNDTGNGMAASYDKELPDFKDEDFVPAPVSAGSCVLIDGRVIHKSSANTSPHPRPAYTFHVIENHQTIYSKENWLQPTAEYKFPSLYEN